MNTKRTTKSKANARLLALLTALCLVIGIVPIVVLAEDDIQVVVDTTGETGYQVEVTENSVSIPIKIYGNCDNIYWMPLIFSNGINYDYDDEVVVGTLEIVDTKDDYAVAIISSDQLFSGSAYYLWLNAFADEYYDEYVATPLKYYSFITEGTRPEEIDTNIEYGDNLLGVRCYVNGNTVVDKWSQNSNTVESAAMSDLAAAPYVNEYDWWNGTVWTDPTGNDAATRHYLDLKNIVAHVGAYSFYGLMNLKEATTHEGTNLSSIGDYAFANCTSLRDFYLYADAEDMDIAPTAFDGCSDVTIHVKPDQLAAYQAKYPDLANVTFAGDLTPDVEPTAPELVSSEGNDLIAKTYTDLELQNAPGEGYEYKFIVYNETTNQWYKLQDFSDATTFRWYTGPAGVKNLYVDIRNKSDETDVTRVELTGVNVTDSGLAATLAIEPTGELAAKTQATLTATATGGTGEYQYKFIVFNATTNQWYKLKDFGPESEFDWYTGPAGTKTLYVDVKDANGVVERAALENIVVK